jgi:hypothetical protein
MIRRVDLILMICAATSAGFAADGPVADAAASEAKRELIALEDVWTTAETNHDAATLTRILDDRFLATWPSGRTIDKGAFIKAETTGPIDRSKSQTLTDRNFIIDGDTAVAVETDTLRSVRDGTPVVWVGRFTLTYIRRNGTWRALAEQAASIAPAKP